MFGRSFHLSVWLSVCRSVRKWVSGLVLSVNSFVFTLVSKVSHWVLLFTQSMNQPFFKLCVYHVLYENDIASFTNLTLNTHKYVCVHNVKPTRVNIALVSLIRVIYMFVLTVFMSLCHRARENISIFYINIWRFMEPFLEFRYVLLGFTLTSKYNEHWFNFIKTFCVEVMKISWYMKIIYANCEVKNYIK